MSHRPPNENHGTLGSRLRQLRNDQGRSLRDVERSHGINSGYLSQIERDEIAKPSPAALDKLARAYELPLGTLMQWAGYVEDQPGPSPNQIRALKYLGEDPTDEELEAIKAVLKVLRKARPTS